MPPSLKPLKWYKKLAAKKGRLESGAFIVEGDRAIRQILSCHPEAIMEIVVILEPSPVYHDYPTRIITENQFGAISSSRTPQGIMAVIRLPEEIYSGSLPEAAGDKILLLEDVQDSGNVGTLIRTAAAFGYSGVIMTENCADPFAPKCVQATAGSVLSLWLRRTGQHLELVRALRKRGYYMVAAELNGETETSVLKQHEKMVLALGNEAAGLSKALLGEADYSLWLPHHRDKAESLNVAACGAILMYLSSGAS